LRTLTPRQRRFVAFYVACLNATEAAKKAGYSEKSADTLGRRLVRKGPVAAAIAEAEAKVLRELEIEAKTVLQETARVALFDPRDLFRMDGTIKPVTEWPTHVVSAVESIEYDELPVAGGHSGLVQLGRVAKVKFWNKLAALELLCRHLGILNDRLLVKDKRVEILEMCDDIYDALSGLKLPVQRLSISTRVVAQV
jgi:phage terminase small subunit